MFCGVWTWLRPSWENVFVREMGLLMRLGWLSIGVVEFVYDTYLDKTIFVCFVFRLNFVREEGSINLFANA